jgi:ATP adenylyltransferase
MRGSRCWAVADPEVGGLGRLWAGWRMPYVSSVTEGPARGSDVANSSGDDPDCVFCRILQSGLPDEETLCVWRNDIAAVICNAYPYASGHVLAMPIRHIAVPEELSEEEGTELWRVMVDCVVAIRRAYKPEGVNVGANLGVAAGAGIPGHLHFHVLPRWVGDTNFMTTVAETRVLPEALSVTWARLREAWPRR